MIRTPNVGIFSGFSLLCHFYKVIQRQQVACVHRLTQSWVSGASPPLQQLICVVPIMVIGSFVWMRKRQEEQQWRPDGWAVVAGMGATTLTSSFQRGATNWFFLSVVLIGSLRPVDAQTKKFLVFPVCVCVDMQFMERQHLFVVFCFLNSSLSFIWRVAAGNNEAYHLYNHFHFKYQLPMIARFQVNPFGD